MEFKIINKLIIRILNIDSPMNESVNHIYFDNYLKEVKCDIEIFEYFMDFPKFERDQEPIFEYFIQKYKNKYCPSRLFEYFSKKNKLRYAILRRELDEIIEKSESEFSDFL